MKSHLIMLFWLLCFFFLFVRTCKEGSSIVCSANQRTKHLNYSMLCAYISLCAVCAQLLQVFVTPWAVARQPPLSVGFSRQECWSASSFPSPGHLCSSGIERPAPALAGDSLPLVSPGKPIQLTILLLYCGSSFVAHLQPCLLCQFDLC